jgi:hypothetical protein
VEVDGNQDEGLVEVWQLPVCNLLAFMFFIIIGNSEVPLSHLNILCIFGTV